MVRLVLEEAAEVRRFRLGDGLLTVGSGEGAKLRVRDASLADVHFELELAGGSALVRPLPGASAPEVDGEPIHGPTRIGLGQVLVVGDVRLHLEADERGTDAPPSGRGSGAAAAPRPRGGRRPRSRMRRTARPVRRGLPAWAVSALVLGGVGLAVLVVSWAFRVQGEQGASPVWAAIQRAEQDLRDGSTANARTVLESLPATRARSADEERRIAELFERIDQREHEERIASHNLVGTKHLETYLRRYEKRWLQGTPEPKKIRLFLKRCAEFRERWPEHPELPWVERLEAHFATQVDLSEDPTWEDIEWEIQHIEGAHWRNYAEAFRLIHEFLPRAKGAEYELATEREQRLREEREAYFRDKLYQARYDYQEKQDVASSVGWLLHLVIWIGDEEMADEAAGYLVKIPRVEAYLEAFRDRYPERYAAVLEHPKVQRFARSKGLL